MLARESIKLLIDVAVNRPSPDELSPTKSGTVSCLIFYLIAKSSSASYKLQDAVAAIVEDNRFEELLSLKKSAVNISSF